MTRIITTLALLLMMLFTNIIQSQNTKKSPCSSEKYNQFNFWEGNWKVYNKNGDLVGTNKLVKMQNNCVLQENWVSNTSISRGTSYSYYNRKDDSWNQLWIDNSGGVLELKGKLVDGKMVLKSDLVTTKKGKFYNRITWFKNKDKSVTQLWETIDEKGKVISEAFRGIYKKE